MQENLQENLQENVEITQENVEKERHGFVTFWLWFMIIAGIVGAIMNFINADTTATNLYFLTGKLINPAIIYVLGLLGLFNVGFSIALLNWKKWGFWAFCVSAVVALIINISIGLASIMPVMVVGGAVSLLILWAILQLKKDGVSCWSNLE